MSGSTREINLGDDFGEVVVRANGASIQIHADGRIDGAPAAANDSLARKALGVGDRLKDGTVCIAVDLKKNEAKFVPAAIFGGKAKFDDQHKIPAQLNQQNAHGHSDWRNITDDGGKTLSEVWDKVAPDELKGRAAPWFWLASPYDGFSGYGRVRRGGEADWGFLYRDHSLPVPVVRSGPARS
jgi:hypothetical protein